MDTVEFPLNQKVHETMSKSFKTVFQPQGRGESAINRRAQKENWFL